MSARLVVTLIAGSLLLLWVMICAAKFWTRSKELMIEIGTIAHVKCENCGTQYDVAAAEYAQMGISRTASKTRTKLKGVAMVNEPEYHYYAKRFYCPHCKNKCFGQVLNIGEIQSKSRGPFLQAGIQCLIMMVIGGMIVFAVSSVPMHFVEKAEQRRIEEMKQQYYEEVKDRYGFGKD